jgi:hypothetical protein
MRGKIYVQVVNKKVCNYFEPGKRLFNFPANIDATNFGNVL